MDATTRWETEALRGTATSRQRPPKPSKSTSRSTSSRQWVTLREAEAETGIPLNTIRKWARREAIPTYLESDGDVALRMVDLRAVRSRADELGRELPPADVDDPPAAPPFTESPPDELTAMPPRSRTGWSGGPPSVPERRTESTRPNLREPERDSEPPDAATMLVPVDAWNKMLTQLGNLHEAGQQLAEARERAAKAETEAAFLRERLAEMRHGPGSDASPSVPTAQPVEPSITGAGAGTPEVRRTGRIATPDPDAIDREQTQPEPTRPEPTDPEPLATEDGQPTAPLWRHLAAGWRGFGRRSRD